MGVVIFLFHMVLSQMVAMLFYAQHKLNMYTSLYLDSNIVRD